MTRAGRIVEYGFFVAAAAALAGLVALAGPRLFSAPQSVTAWIWGCTVSLAASVGAGLLLPLLGGRARGGSAALAVMAVRLALLVLGGAATVLLAELEMRPFLLAVAASYLPLLVVDTAYAVRLTGRL